MTDRQPGPAAPRLLTVVAAALTDAAGRVLVQCRPPGKAHAGLWEFPGGKVEADEDPEAALARELMEELGIGVDPAAMTPLHFASLSGGERHLLLLLYRVDTWSGEMHAAAADELAWHSPADLSTLAMPPADGPLVAAIVREAACRAASCA